MSDTYEIEVGPKGRVVIPAPIRAELGIATGTRLVAFVEDGALLLATPETLERQVQAMFADVPGGMVDSLLAERRREVEMAETEATDRRRKRRT